MIKTINLNGQEIKYDLERKKVKNINLRIKPDLSIHISATKWVSEKYIEDFLRSKSDFILDALSKYSNLEKPQPITYTSGEKLSVLGKECNLIVNKSNKNNVIFDDENIFLFVKDPDDFELKKKVINNWKKERCSEIVNDICKKVFPMFESHLKSFPEIKFRNMVSQWGNCHPLKNVLTFNVALFDVPLVCIEYVVLHEFTHFIEPNHSAKFYQQLENFLPDWKERKKILKNYRILK